MEKEKFKVADFSALIGCSQKTVYSLIDKGELKTVNETSKGRKIVLVLATDAEIKELQKIYGKNLVNEVNCKENETQYIETESKNLNYSIETPTFFEKVIELQNTFNEQIMKYNDELIKFKSQVPLLEDRQGLYLQQIKDFEAENNTLKKDNNILLKWLITVIILAILIIAALGVALAFYYNKPPKVIETEKVVTVEKPVYVKGKR
ncbi:MAG: hypothetical protein J6Q32_05965 [Clostridia bacterium]|nr:hypothetical protein [Clostridia bacterium]